MGRARELGRGHKWKRGGGRAGRGGSVVAGERAVVGASTAGDRGREVRDALTGGVDGAERERERARESNDEAGPTEQRESE
jgi:hypothetical protein